LFKSKGKIPILSRISTKNLLFHISVIIEVPAIVASLTILPDNFFIRIEGKKRYFSALSKISGRFSLNQINLLMVLKLYG